MQRKVCAAWALIAILSFSILSVTWLSLTGATEFTSGKPERSELIVEIEVDSEETTQDIRIEKATPFVLWMLVRDSVGEENNVENSSTTEVNAEPESDSSSMETMQSLLGALVSAFGFAAILSVFQIRIRMRWIFAIWGLGLILFLCLPVAWMGDMGDSLDSGLPAEQGPEEDEAFVHINSETHFQIVLIGLEFHFSGDGWDLGMVDEEERAATIEQPPSDEEHDAHIAWDGELSLRYGNALNLWLVVGLLLFVVITFERFEKQNNMAELCE